MEKQLVIFVTTATSSNRTPEENLGLGYLAAICRNKSIETLLIDGWLEELTSEDIISRILKQRHPLFVGFSCNLLTGDTAIDIVKQLKRKNYPSPLIAGGFAPTLNPTKFLNAGFDFISIAEGENSISSFCDYLLDDKSDISDVCGLCYYNKQKNLCYNKTDCALELDELPFPTRDTMGYVIKNKIPVNISSSRGCTSSCLFCSIAAFWRTTNAPKWRGRSVNNIIDEIEELYNKGARFFKFVDDSFIEPPRDGEWCNHFANEIQKRGLKIQFRITMRADCVTEEIIEPLCRAGCNSIVLGVENFNDNALKRMGKKADAKQNMIALDILKKYDIYVLHGFILFDYKTNLLELKENYEIMSRYSWVICKGIFSEMYAATGTLYTKLLRKKGLVNSDERYENYTYEIQDEQAKMAYKALKIWHINHMKIYDMMIEPMNKPRVLSKLGFSSFYKVYKEIRTRDLEFMRSVLDRIENDVEPKLLDDFVLGEISKSKKWFEDCGQRVEDIYTSENITYLAEEDPFTCVRN